MSAEAYSKANLLTPDYWGVDIYDDWIKVDNTNGRIMLDKKTYKRTTGGLEQAAMAIYQGGTSQARYMPGREFLPTRDVLPDGSVTILEYEGLTRDIGQQNFVKPRTVNRMYQPYLEYWRQNLATHDLGIDRQPFPDDRVLYTKLLRWGVLTTAADGLRVVQEYDFKMLLPTKNGFKYLEQPGHAEVLPLQPGETSAGRGYFGGVDRVAVTRLTGIELVYLPDHKPGDNGRERRLTFNLGKLALKPGIHHI